MNISSLLNKSLMSELDISDCELDLTLHFEEEDLEEFSIEEDSEYSYGSEYSEEEEFVDAETEGMEEEEEEDSGEDSENSDEISYD